MISDQSKFNEERVQSGENSFEGIGQIPFNMEDGKSSFLKWVRVVRIP